MNKAAIGIVEKLMRQADQTSSIHREMAEAKSLRQESNTERRTDLYMWPTPEQTTEGQAAAIIMEMVEALEPFAKFNLSGFDGPVMEVVPPWAENPAHRIEPIYREHFVRARTLITKVRGK